MKRFGLGVLGFFLVAANLQAGVLPIVNVRLQSKLTPFSKAFPAKQIDVDSNGDVVVSGKTQVVFEHFSVDKMDQIDNLVQEASDETLQSPDPRGVHCMAMSVYKMEMSADNGNVLLQSGAVPCGFITKRVGPATDELIKILVDETTKINENHVN